MGEKKKKKRTVMLGEKKKAFSFGEAMSEMMPEIAKKMCPGAA